MCRQGRQAGRQGRQCRQADKAGRIGKAVPDGAQRVSKWRLAASKWRLEEAGRAGRNAVRQTGKAYWAGRKAGGQEIGIQGSLTGSQDVQARQTGRKAKQEGKAGRQARQAL